MKHAFSSTIRLAAFDLDGTLLGPGASISPENLAALTSLHRRGIEIVLASGRHPLNMKRFVEHLPFVRWLVSAQGGEVSSTRERQIIYSAFLNPSSVRHAIELGLHLGFSPVAYLPDETCAVCDDLGVQHYARLAGGLPRITDASHIIASSVFKVLWIGSEPAQCDRATEAAAQAALVSVRTHPRIVEIVPPNVNKGTALAVLASHLGISPAETVAFGDGENDLPMFAWAGVSVAMPHGWPNARQQASLVAPDGPLETALARGIAMLFPEADPTKTA